jgi:hypothetical protein
VGPPAGRPRGERCQEAAGRLRHSHRHPALRADGSDRRDSIADGLTESDRRTGRPWAAQVIARSSVERYTDRPIDLARVAREPTSISSGEASGATGRVRATRLVRSSDQSRVWAETYDARRCSACSGRSPAPPPGGSASPWIR